MTDLCYDRIECPSVFPQNSDDCADLQHDIRIIGGCLEEGDSVLSAILIQLGSHRLVEGERGWWGEQFLGFQLGTRVWKIAGRALSENVRAELDESIREALDPLIDQGCIDEVSVRVIDTFDGPQARVRVFKDGRELLEVAM